MLNRRVKKILGKADERFDFGEYEDAIKYYDMVLKIEPDNMAAMVGRDRAYRLAEKDNVATQRFLKRNNMDSPTLYMMGGQMLVNAKQYSRAIDTFNIVAATHPNNHMAHFSMGEAFLEYSKKTKKGLLKKALKCYNDTLRIKPDFNDAIYNRTMVLFHLKKYERAIKHCDEMLSINPDDAVALEQKGYNLNGMHEYEDAVRCFDEALKISPDEGSVMYNKSVVLYNMRKSKEALKLLDEAVRASPRLKRYTRFRRMLLDHIAYEKKGKFCTCPDCS